MITYEDIKNDKTINTYIRKADEALSIIGYTDHGFSHVIKVAETTKYILSTLSYPERTAELAAIAGYLHDIGNLINRANHANNGAVMAFKILSDMGMDPDEISVIVSAIGNHDEKTAQVISPVTAALIIADKTDARYTRVRHRDTKSFDQHDRVNYSVRESKVFINKKHTTLTLDLTIDTNICTVFDYFEIFTNRTILCRQAAKKLNLTFNLIINGQQLV